jgi:UDP-GlcNAc:undecaprenyl-phosphate/decaprenyl-phosphate GlcNAc-1-phosphate transferase
MNENGEIYFAAAALIGTYLLSTALVMPIRTLALRFSVLDEPGARKYHKVPTPLLGGLAILGATVTALGALYSFFPSLHSQGLPKTSSDCLRPFTALGAGSSRIFWLLGGVLLITLTGFIDDVLRHFHPVKKLLCQTVAALFLLPTGVHIGLLGLDGPLSMVLASVWVVCMTNSFNLLDNMNGLSSGVSVICSAVLLVFVLARQDVYGILLLSGLIGGILGFFQFNFTKGFIFLGDTGSLLLGYLLGFASLLAMDRCRTGHPSSFAFLVPPLVLGLPILDTLSVIYIRLREGRPIYLGDQMHISHRLVRMGMGSRQAVCVNFLAAFVLASAALYTIDSTFLHGPLPILQATALAAIFYLIMRTWRQNVSVDAASLPESGQPSGVSSP